MRRYVRWPRSWLGRVLLIAITVVVLIGGIAALASGTGRVGNESRVGPYAGSGAVDVPGNAKGVPAATAAAGAPMAQSAASNTASGQSTSANITVPDPQRQIIKTGSLTLVAQNVEAVAALARSITQGHGGMVTQSNISKVGGNTIADLTVQVPADQFDATMAALSGMTGVTDRPVDKTSSQDVTAQYVDVKAQIKNLQVTEQQLQTLMGRATLMADIIAIQRELTNVRGQIDRLQGQLNYLESRTAMSTIVLRVEPPASAGPVPGWHFSEVVARAWTRSVIVIQGVADALITVVVFSVWLLPVLGLGWLAWKLSARRHTTAPAPEARPSDV